jgi:hypothetical protein
MKAAYTRNRPLIYKGTTLVAALSCVLFGCAGQPRTPQQQAALDQQSYCQLQAQAARNALEAQQDQSRQPVGGFYGGAAQGAALATAYDAAYERCMMEMRRR